MPVSETRTYVKTNELIINTAIQYNLSCNSIFPKTKYFILILGFDYDASSVKQLQETIESNGGPVVLNYRFLREFTKGIDPSTTHWSISAINHFKLNEQER